MSPDTVQQIFQAADVVINTLETENDRITLEQLVTRIVDATSFTAAVVKPVAKLYVKGRSDLKIRAGRLGGIRRVFKAAEVVTVEADQDAGQDMAQSA